VIHDHICSCCNHCIHGEIAHKTRELLEISSSSVKALGPCKGRVVDACPPSSDGKCRTSSVHASLSTCVLRALRTPLTSSLSRLLSFLFPQSVCKTLAQSADEKTIMQNNQVTVLLSWHCTVSSTRTYNLRSCFGVCVYGEAPCITWAHMPLHHVHIAIHTRGVEEAVQTSTESSWEHVTQFVGW